jgi:hypothetical protein
VTRLVDINQTFSNLENSIVNSLPSIILAIIVIILGLAIGILVGRLAKNLTKKLGVQKTFDTTSAGKAFLASGWDLSSMVGGLVAAFITVLGVILGIQLLSIGGIAGSYLISVAGYLPRLLGGIAIIIVGLILVDLLAGFIGNMIKPMFPETKAGVADMLKNLLLIGLIAFVLLLALDVMLLTGTTIYSLILGFVIIAAGIALTDGLIKSLADEHAEFKGVAGYAKFVLYAVFLIIGAGGIFATFPGVTGIIANISWGFAIALAIMLVPIAYTMAKRMSKE